MLQIVQNAILILSLLVTIFGISAVFHHWVKHWKQSKQRNQARRR